MNKTILSKILGQNFSLYHENSSILANKNIKFENFSSKLLLSRIRKNGIFLDVGANIGFYSVLVGKEFKKNKIICIEPVKDNFKLLLKNLKYNNINNVESYNLAASNEEKFKKINIALSKGSSSFYKPQHSSIDAEEVVKAVPLDKIISSRKIDFIKIDVEGHEIETLEGLNKVFKNNPNLEMLIEFNPNSQISANRNPKELLVKLISLNFDLYAIIDYPWQKPGYENMSYSDISELYKIKKNTPWQKFVNRDHHVNLLCIPKNKSKFVTFFSHDSQLTGAERSMLELINELKERKILSHVVLPNEGPLQNELEKINIPYDIVNLNWWAKTEQKESDENRLNNPSSLKDLIDYLPKLFLINPDLIYSNTIVSPWGAIAANYFNKPHIWHIREYGVLDHKFNFEAPYKEMINFIEKFSDQIIVNSQSVSNHITQYLKSKKPHVIYNYINIEPDLLKEKVRNPFKSKNSVKILVCGTVQEGKNQLEAVKAVRNLIKNQIDVELLVIGIVSNQNYLNQIIKYISVNKIKNYVHILNVSNNPYPYFKMSDVILIPSYKEAYGRTAVEAMLLKKPVVTTIEGGTKEIIKNNINGFTYHVGNIQELQIQLTKLTDCKLQKRIGLLGYNSLKKINNKIEYGYKIAKIIENTVDDYKPKNETIKIVVNMFKKNSLNFKIDIQNLESTLNNIKSSKFFKLWQLFCKYRNNLLGK